MEDAIRQRAYCIWRDTGCDDALQNWLLAEQQVRAEAKLNECPICLDTLQQPWTLPCGHTACIGCWLHMWDADVFAQLHPALLFCRGGKHADTLWTFTTRGGGQLEWKKNPRHLCVYRCVPWPADKPPRRRVTTIFPHFSAPAVHFFM